MYALESAVLTAWYCSHPEIRRLLAVSDTEGSLLIRLQLEPAQDSGELNPVWLANRREWKDELQWHTGTSVRLESLEESEEGYSLSREIIVADLSWRDPSSFVG